MENGYVTNTAQPGSCSQPREPRKVGVIEVRIQTVRLPLLVDGIFLSVENPNKCIQIQRFRSKFIVTCTHNSWGESKPNKLSDYETNT